MEKISPMERREKQPAPDSIRNTCTRVTPPTSPYKINPFSIFYAVLDCIVRMNFNERLRVFACQLWHLTSTSASMPLTRNAPGRQTEWKFCICFFVRWLIDRCFKLRLARWCENFLRVYLTKRSRMSWIRTRPLE